MRRLLEEFRRWRRLHNLSQVHHGDTVTEVLNHTKVVRNEKIREAELLLEFCEQVQHLRLNGDIER